MSSAVISTMLGRAARGPLRRVAGGRSSGARPRRPATGPASGAAWSAPTGRLGHDGHAGDDEPDDDAASSAARPVEGGRLRAGAPSPARASDAFPFIDRS